MMQNWESPIPLVLRLKLLDSVMIKYIVYIGFFKSLSAKHISNIK